ncbi:hypothetical protein BIW11_10757 [Tropilaelaps mercedesae]|uniref:Uncharacterized protein n=1 Tax=Tropilaelaps mercedesae TaxID=418985 RepID=A0A1V9XEQ3_9ACAR|nr:hypothetical protein BIW11_10757 [Tropilaelaps mercedesae]
MYISDITCIEYEKPTVQYAICAIPEKMVQRNILCSIATVTKRKERK